MDHYRRAAPFIVVAVLAYLVWRAEEAGIAALIATLSLGIGLAMLYRPEVAGPLRMLAWADLRNIGLLAMSMLNAVIMIGWIDWLFGPDLPSYNNPRDLMAAQIVWSLYALTGGIAVLPFLGQIVRNGIRPERVAPQWPAALGPAAALSIGMALIIAWVGIGDWAVTRAPSGPENRIAAIAVLGSAGLFAGMGGPLWWRAMAADEGSCLDTRGVFGQSMVAMIVGLVSGSAVAGGLMVDAGAAADATGLLSASMLSIMVGGAWLSVAWRLRSCEPAGAGRAIAAVAIILVAFIFSLMVPGFVAGAREWASLVLIFTAPLSLGVAVLVVVLIAPLVRKVATGRQRDGNDAPQPQRFSTR